MTNLILVSVLLTVMGFVFLYLTVNVFVGKKFWYSLSVVATICFLTFGITSLFVGVTRTTLEDDLRYYENLRCKCEILNDKDAVLSLDMVIGMRNDIRETNYRIRKSRKYYNHWYLKALFYKEVGELEILKCDTIKAKVTMR